VDKCVKENQMEKTISELDTTWANMKFDVEVHSRTKVFLIKPSDELIETFEDNQMQLQNMSTSKFVGQYLTEVTSWQKVLSQADQVISVMLDVQRAWSHLESIFVDSEDIRKKLPDDSKRFDGIDIDFKVICEENNKNLNVIVCTNRPGLYERLENIQEKLSLCEKALAEYLEAKRLSFPR
jgi:dynein heavy chain